MYTGLWLCSVKERMAQRLVTCIPAAEMCGFDKYFTKKCIEAYLPLLETASANPRGCNTPVILRVPGAAALNATGHTA